MYEVYRSKYNNLDAITKTEHCPEESFIFAFGNAFFFLVFFGVAFSDENACEFMITEWCSCSDVELVIAERDSRNRGRLKKKRKKVV